MWEAGGEVVHTVGLTSLAGGGCPLIDFPFSLPHSVKGPELINMYVGQSEENVRNGEDLHPAPAHMDMGHFCSTAGKEAMLKPPSQLPHTALSRGLNPAVFYSWLPAASPPALSLYSCYSCPCVPDGTAAPQRHN